MKFRFFSGGAVFTADEDQSYCYLWWRDVHCLMGDEGFKAGLYIVRASEPAPKFDIPRFHFKVSAKAVVQSGVFQELEVVDGHSGGHLDLSKIQELRDPGVKARANWQKFGQLTEDHDNWDKSNPYNPYDVYLWI